MPGEKKAGLNYTIKAAKYSFKYFAKFGNKKHTCK